MSGNSESAIGHLAYAFLILGVIVIIILVTVILSQNSQLSSQSQAEVNYFNNQIPIPTQSCAVLVSNYALAFHDSSTYSQFAPPNYFQDLSNQYLAQINAKNCSSG
ncbi:MAG: hypothetical protein ACHQ1H_05620 [Nitrososphaerales archaeon]